MGARVTGTPATRKKTGAAVSATETPAPETAGDRIVLITIDDHEYTAPARVTFGLSLRYLDLTARFKPQYAQLAMVKELIGQEAFDELTASTVSKADWKRLVDAAATHLLGSIEQEEAQGN
ncbi:MAG: hypothetical protein ACRDRN_20665 [Sciscionella sp.]